jgi:iron(III) transport system substrate-binding protein
MRAIVLRVVGSLILLGLAAAPLYAQMPAWEKQLYEAAKKEKELTIYTAHYSTEYAQALCDGFDKKYPGVKCNFIRTTAQVAYQRLSQDKAAGLHIASIISSTDLSHYPKMKADGWLMKYKPHNLSNMIDAFKPYNDPDDEYFVTSAGLVMITYNTDLVKGADIPKKWTDLLDPKWKDKVSIGHPGFSGYVGTWVVLMRKMYKWDYFTALEKNKPQIGRSINDTVTMLNAKERWVAAGPSATTLKSRDKGNPIGVVYPEDGSLLMIAPTGILADAPSPNAAKLHLEFLLSKEASEIHVKERGEAIAKGVKVLPGARSLEQVKTVRPTLEEIDKGIPEVKEQFRDTFGI